MAPARFWRGPRSSRARRVAAFVTFLAVLVWLARPHAAGASAASCEFQGVERIVAVGDVHGAYDRYVGILRAAQVVDERLRWSGGHTHLVQLGDVVDRGPDSRKVLDLLRRLDREASSAGGRVHFLIGNHEVMRLLGDLRYAHAGEYSAFVTNESEDVRQRYAQTAGAARREQTLKDTPLGFLEMRVAFGRQGPYGQLLRSLNAVVRINGVVFLHGGISPAVAPLQCAALNDTMRRELGGDLDKTRASPQRALTTREDGPLWYRGLAQEPDTFGSDVQAILAKQEARAIVIAHTVTPSRRISARFDGRVFMLDTGMQPLYVSDGRASALEIRGETYTAIYVDGREHVSGPAAVPTP